MEKFTSAKIETYISPSWVDLTPDVLGNPLPRWNTGIMGNSPQDRVGDPEHLTFSLKNRVKNSAGVQGYYSPDHASKLTGWTTGLRVRLSFVYEGVTYYKWHGRIEPDGIDVIPGARGSRRVDVNCHGFMSQAASHDFSIQTLASNKRADEAVALILAGMAVSPLATSYAAGISTFPTVFDTVQRETKVISELQKIAMSELCYIYIKGDQTGGETLVVENQNTRVGQTENTKLPVAQSESGYLVKADNSGYILNANAAAGKIILNLTQVAEFDNSMLNLDMEVGYGRHLTNLVKAVVYPRRIDSAATTVLATLQNTIQLAPSETKSGIRVYYRDPSGGASYVNGKDMVTPAATTDYTANTAEDGTGTDKTAQLSVVATYGTEAVEWSVTNNDAGTIYVTKLQGRGRGIYRYDPTTTVKEDATSQASHGIRSMTIEMPYQDDPGLGEDYADFVLTRQKDPNTTIDRVSMMVNQNSLTMYAFLRLEPGTRCRFKESVTGINGDYFIMGYSAELILGATPMVKWMPVLKFNLEEGG